MYPRTDGRDSRTGEGGALSGSRLNLSHLSEPECERILTMLQRDYTLRHKERSRIRPEDTINKSSGKPPKPPRAFTSTSASPDQIQYRPLATDASLSLSLKQFISKPNHTETGSRLEVQSQSEGRSDQSEDRFCHRCSEVLSMVRKRKALCSVCHHWICKLCVSWEPESLSYICAVHEEADDSGISNQNSDDLRSSLNFNQGEGRFLTTDGEDIVDDSLNERLNGSGLKATTVTDSMGIPELNMSEFEQFMKSAYSQPQSGVLDPVDLTDTVNRQSPRLSKTLRREDGPGAHRISVTDFFRAPGEPGQHQLTALKGKMAEIDSMLSNETSKFFDTQQFYNGKAEENLSFSDTEEREVKEFLRKLDQLVKLLQESLSNDDDEQHTEDTLQYYQSTLSSTISDLEQSLHIAVDAQTCALGEMVHHADVPPIVASALEAAIGEPLSADAYNKKEKTIDTIEAANAILTKVLDEEEEISQDDDNDVQSRDSSKQEETNNYSGGYSSLKDYKLPVFELNDTAAPMDSDLLSISSFSIALTPDAAGNESGDDRISESESRWDTESVVSTISLTSGSSNWLLRGRPNMLSNQLDSLSASSNMFNSDYRSSGSEESLVMAVPPSAGEMPRVGECPIREFEGEGDDSDTASTLTTLSDEDLTSEFIKTQLSNLGHESEFTMVTKDNNDNKLNITVSGNGGMDDLVSETSTNDLIEDGEENEGLLFSLKPRTRTVQQGDVARFTCRLESSTPVDVYWFKEEGGDTEAIETNEKYEVTDGDTNEHTLEIYCSTSQDVGQYLCLAKNYSTSSHWLFGLKVDSPDGVAEDKPPLFLKELYDVETYEGDTVKLRCKIRAFPPPRVCWYQDGQRIDNSKHFSLDKFGNRDYMLTIYDVTSEHDSEFTVLGRNSAGEAKSTCQLLVELNEDEMEAAIPVRRSSKYVSPQCNRRQQHYNSAFGGDEQRLRGRRPNSRNSSFSSTSTDATRDSVFSPAPSVHGPICEDRLSPVSFEQVETEPSKLEPLPESSQPNGSIPNGQNHSFIKSPPQDNIDQLKDSTSNKIMQAPPTTKSNPKQTSGSEPSTSVQNAEPSIKPEPGKRSLRSAIRREPVTVEEIVATVAPTPSPVFPEVSPPPIPVKPKEEERQTSTVQLIKITPLKTDLATPPSPSTKPHEPTSSSTKSSPVKIDQPKPTSGYISENHNSAGIKLSLKSPRLASQNSATKPASEPSVKNSTLASKPRNVADIPDPVKQNRLSQRSSVDIQPGFVRERLFLESGAHNQPSPTKGCAPIPPSLSSVPDPVTIMSEVEQDAIPSSRGEWDAFFPSVKQRRASFSSDSSQSEIRDRNTIETKPDLAKNTRTKSANPVKEPQPLSSATTMPSQEGPRKVKRVVSVKRTSVKRVTAPPTFGDGPPNDGHEYIKICGKWVKMKPKSKQVEEKPKVANGMPEGARGEIERSDPTRRLLRGSTSEDQVPASKSEWGGGVSVGEGMTQFKNEREKTGQVLSGRTFGGLV